MPQGPYKFPFIGGSYPSESPNADAQRTINWYPEQVESGTGKAPAVLYRTPGLQLFTTLPQSPGRGLWAGEGRLFAASGSRLYEVFADGSYNDRGDIGNDGNPVTILPNGNQLGIISAGQFWCDDGSGPNAVNYDDGSGPVIACSGTYMDGTFIVAGPNPEFGGTGPVSPSECFGGNTWQLSNFLPLGGDDWNPLDYATKEGYPDHINCILADHEDLWIFGDEQSTEVWQDTGNANFPYQRDTGGFIHYGLAAPYSVARLDNGLAWLSADVVRGGFMAVYAQGFVPVRISTHAMEQVWNSFPTISDAISFSYTENGHLFWVISFPTANRTFCLDKTTGIWHERGWWNGSSLDRARGAFHAYVSLDAHGGQGSGKDGFVLSGPHFQLDWQNGNIYTASTSYLDDAGTPIHRIRTAPHVSDEELLTNFDSLQLDIQTGVGGTAQCAPILDWSDDHGHTFSNARPPDSPASGIATQLTDRVIWRRLGQSRDRVFRVTITDAADIALINAYLRTRPCTS
jgi:hypothetical protein